MFRLKSFALIQTRRIVVQRTAFYATNATSSQSRLQTQGRLLKQKIREQKQPILEYVDYSDSTEFMMEEGLGQEAKLNWAINYYAVTPKRLAFRNLDTERLVTRSSSAKNEDGQLVLDLDKSHSDYQLYYVGASAQGQNSVSLDNYRRISARVRSEHLSDASELFVQDCAVGATRVARHNLRLITNDAAYAAFANNIFSKLPIKNTEPGDFKHPFTAFVAPDMTIDDFESFGLKSKRAVFVNAATGTIVAVGVPPEALQRAAAAVMAERLVAPHVQSAQAAADVRAANQQAEKHAKAKGEEAKTAEVPSVEPLDGVLLASDAVHYADQTVLVLGATPEMKTGGLQRYLAGSNYNVLSKDGVAPLLNGVTSSSSDKKVGNVVVKTGGASATTTRNALTRNTPLASPSAVVLVVNDASLPSSASLSTVDAAKHIVAGYRGEQQCDGLGDAAPSSAAWNVIAERLETLLDQSKAKIYVVNVANNNKNSKSKQKNAGIEKIMLDIFGKKHSTNKSDDEQYLKKTKSIVDNFLKSFK